MEALLELSHEKYTHSSPVNPNLWLSLTHSTPLSPSIIKNIRATAINKTAMRTLCNDCPSCLDTNDEEEF